MHIFGFEKLDTWQFAKKLVLDVYKITKKFPTTEQFGLVSQMNRAAISVPSNIAEGVGRSSSKEQVHFLDIAYGSLMELACQLSISWELEYIITKDYEQIRKDILVLTKMLLKLKSSLKK